VYYLLKYPDQFLVSKEPTYRDGWCKWDQRAKLGKIAHRAAVIANRAAEGIDKRFSNDLKLVGMLGYGLHW
jgi:hypothetical protein